MLKKKFEINNLSYLMVELGCGKSAGGRILRAMVVQQSVQ